MQQDRPPGRNGALGQLGSTLPRRIALIVALSLGAYLLIPRLVGIPNAFALLRHAGIGSLVAALVWQTASVFSQTYSAQRIISSLGSHLGFWKTLRLMLASAVATLLVPSAGLSGIALRARYLGEWGYASEVTLLAYALEVLGQGVGELVLLSGALLRQTLAGGAANWRPLLLLAGGLSLAVGILTLLLSRPERRDWRYALLARLNAFLVRVRRRPLPASALEERLRNLRAGLRSLGPRVQASVLLAGIFRVVASALCLQMALKAFGETVPLWVIMTAFTISDVLGYLSTLPGGLGVIDTSLMALLAGSGVPLEAATAATLTFRLLTFWLPRALGVFTWFDLQRNSARPLW